LLKKRSKTKMAMLESIDSPAGFLAPLGRATQQIHVEEAHSCGEFLASKSAQIICSEPSGEVGIALLTGSLSTGGQVKIYTDQTHKGIGRPEGAQIVEAGADATKRILSEIGHFWVMPPAFADLERYLKVWVSSGYRPLVCLSPRDEFLLLRGFVQEIVAVGCPTAAERLVFARTPEDGWDKLAELLS
jgi:hypothetical protein